jgi:hypothetical protein
MAPEVKTAKNSKLPKMSESCFEPVGKGGWPPISIWITKPLQIKFKHNLAVANGCERILELENPTENPRIEGVGGFY